MSELFRSANSDGTETFSMRHIAVDGMFTSNNRDYGYNFFSMKPDYWPIEDKYVDQGGYLTEDAVYWEGAYSPIPYSYGEMDEEEWLRSGTIVAINHPW